MIRFDEKNQIFKLDTANTSYVMGIAGGKYLLHIYYGKRLGTTELGYLLELGGENLGEAVFHPGEKVAMLECLTQEYSFAGVGDFRESCLDVTSAAGQRGVELLYDSYEIIDGKPALEGLPATFGENAQTLKITLKDACLSLRVELSYSVFADVDAVLRSVCVHNDSGEIVKLNRVLSACLDMLQTDDVEALSLHGAWGRERHTERQRIGYGSYTISSKRGISSPQSHPFLAMISPDCTQERGEVYAMHFVYSGNFMASIEKSQFGKYRMVLGIHPEGFCWELKAGEHFQAPEAVLVYSDAGLEHMTHTFHDLYRNHLIRKEWVYKKRPVLINNWEATYFDFDTEKLLAIAKEASENGIEMLVMDDGWFGKRNDDKTSLGDWTVNEEKLPGGLKRLADEVNALGMKLGIWLEPEMISKDSELYRNHPDWALALDGREASQSRNQYVLDLSRPEVLEYVYQSVAGVLRSANIEYVKWDMNRQLTDVGSTYLPAERQGELLHRHTLAVYALQERLLQEFPYLLLENCASGGARFDPGMLYYSPQIWCSDNTDAIERLAIQEGTELIYPLSVIGAHVADCPNHSVGRTTPFDTRAIVAMAGTFGYELDITRISEEDRAKIAGQVQTYQKNIDLIQGGDYYRLASYQENHYFDCYEIVSKDKKRAMVVYIQVLGETNMHSHIIRLRGLDPQGVYHMEGKKYHAGALMRAGLPLKRLWGDFQAEVLWLEQEA